MIPTRQRFRALMVALAHFVPLADLVRWLEAPAAPPADEVSWSGLLWSLYAEPEPWDTQCFWESTCRALTDAPPWLQETIAAWVSGDIPQASLAFAVVSEAIALGDRLYRDWAGLGGTAMPAVTPPPDLAARFSRKPPATQFPWA